MSTAAVQPRLERSTTFEPRPPRVNPEPTSEQQRPDGQLGLRLWPGTPEAPLGQRTDTVDRNKLTAVLTALLEVEDGSRPIAQLRDVLHPALYNELGARPRRTGPRFRLRSTHVQRPNDRVIEACGLLTAGNRTLSMCARFDSGTHGWFCTHFAVVYPGHAVGSVSARSA